MYFPRLQRPPDDMTHIIGIVPTTAQTAFNIAQSWHIEHKCKVKVILFFPTKVGTENEELTEKIKTWANKAEVIFSVGPKLKAYYDEIFPKQNLIKHHMFAYHPRSIEKEERPPAPFEIASFYTLGANVETNSEIKKDYKKASQALAGIVVEEDKFQMLPMWNVYTDNENLDAKTLSKNEQYRFEKRVPCATKEELSDNLYSVSMILAPETESHGFNFEAWEALGAGYPTLVTAASGVGQLLRQEAVMSLYSSRLVFIRQD